MTRISWRLTSRAGSTLLLLLAVSLLTFAPAPLHEDWQASVMAFLPPRSQTELDSVMVSHSSAIAATAQCRSWQAFALPDGSAIAAIAAISATDVWAVGGMTTESTDQQQPPILQQPLILHWDGTRWSVVPGAPVKDGGALVAVAAISPTDIWAVGRGDYGYFDDALIEHWDGTTWHIVPGAATNGYYLSSVAGLTGNDVWIVGARVGAVGTLIEHWNGRRWHAVPGAPLGPYSSALNAVTAVSRDDVWAVGENSGEGHTALIEHWDGRRWRVAPSPEIANYDNGGLSSITAVSANDLWAVGRYANVDHLGGVLVEHWDGSTWSLVPSPKAIFINLVAVAAVSARDVWAAGPNFIEHWDGTRWQIVPSPGSAATSLAVVSPHDVWAAGGDLIAHYSGRLCSAVKPAARRVRLHDDVGIVAGSRSISLLPRAMVVDGKTRRALILDNSGQTITLLDTAHGTVLRRIKLGSSSYLALDERAGRVYAARGYGSTASVSIAILDATSGARLGRLAGGAHAWQVAVDERAGTLFVLNGANPETEVGGGVTVLNAATGTLVRSVAISDPVAMAVDEHAEHVFVSASDGVTMLDATTGAVLRTVPIADLNPQYPPQALAIDDRAGRLFIGMLDDSNNEGTLNVLSTASGALLRTIDLGYDSQGGVGALAVDRRTGNLIMSGTYGGVWIINPVSGATVFRLGADAEPDAVAVNERLGRIYVSCILDSNQYGDPLSNGEVQVFDEATGTLLTRVSVPPGPDMLAVDDRSGQVLVLHQGGVTLIPPTAGDTMMVR